MKVRCITGTIGLNWNQYERGAVFECPDDVGQRLIINGSAELVVDPQEPIKEELPLKKTRGKWGK